MESFAWIRPGEEPYMQFDGFKLRNYFPKEIERLSVVQVTQTKTFDEVGHPVSGGLYDSAFGPGPGERCETCQQYEHYCPGHLGHIKLDVPVFNPLFYKFTFNLLKGTCVSCHRFTCKSDGLESRVLLAELRCFELGVPHLAMEVGKVVQDQLKNRELAMEMEDKESEAHQAAELDALIGTMAEKSIERMQCEVGMPTKNAVEMKKALLKQFCRENLFKRLRKCPLCKGKNGQLRNDTARSILLDFSSSTQGMTKAKTAKTKSVATIDAFAMNELDGEEKENDDYEPTDEDEEKKNDMKENEKGLNIAEGTLEQQLESVRSGKCDKLAWRGAEVREHFRLLFKKDGKFLLKIFPMLAEYLDSTLTICPLDCLFCETIVVPPKKFRPIRLFQGQQYEDPQTVNLRRVLEASETMKAIALVMKGEESAVLSELIAARTGGKTLAARMHDAYLTLQMAVNGIFDEDLCKKDNNRIAGIKQILEKKQGLFRMNMMGKRVNYACRSVITPDPYLDIDEIGIPDIFARKLTFTEPVNVFNLPRLRQAVRNGPKIHPGANYVQLPNGKKQMLGDLSPDEIRRRMGLANTLAPIDKESLRYPYMVHRHLLNGDMLVMNRQPSLHKPSMLGHRTRVLFGQRALRMNYAPCKAYNADFDGDEMNGHLVQSYQGQTEVREIVNVGSNLLVPKDATPLLGLIQDHVVSGVLLTLRDRFLQKEDFMHLVLAAFGYHSARIDIPPPTIIKPVKLWTGKQVISCLIKNCTPAGKPLINLDGKSKTPLSCWKVKGYDLPQFEMSESHVIIRDGELLSGVFDKSHFGATQYGLMHCVFELYGHRVGVKLFSCFSRLFTTFLQLHGFTLGVADILVCEDADAKRKKAVLKSREIGDEVVCNAFGLPPETPQHELKRVIASAYCNPRGDQLNVKMLDLAMKTSIANYTDVVNKACVPAGLIRSFPENALQMMIQSGAKGSSVNAMQISCGLGQIELEGKRMAVTIAGRTLPSFPAFDSSPRAGGFIDQRFLTGINPQELFFHTMAGREGLIDTAVKTSRSGYLQRCIIKHLEGIKVHYDSTVRDHDGSIIQFRYGEDALDVCKSSFLNSRSISVLCDNMEALELSCKPQGANDKEYGIDETEKHYRKIVRHRRRVAKAGLTKKRQFYNAFTSFSDKNEHLEKDIVTAMWHEMDEQGRMQCWDKLHLPPPAPVDERFNVTRTLGALPEKTLDLINKTCGPEEEKLKRVLMWKGMSSLVEPGENVGLLAAQSIGEPSTQMTLNTFHFAGRGEMNVTLGIPRLREILMTQSKNIATPSAQIAVMQDTPRERIDLIKQELDRVYMKQVLKSFTLEEKVNMYRTENWRRYVLRINLLETKKREVAARWLRNSKIVKMLELRFMRIVALAISKKYHEVLQYQQLQHRKLKKGNLTAGGEDEQGSGKKNRGLMGPDDGESSDEEADGGKEADAAEKRLHQRHMDEADYEGEDEEKQGQERAEATDEDEDIIDEEIKEKETEKDDESSEEEGGAASPDDKLLNGHSKVADDYDNRVRYVLGLSDMITGYSYDKKKGSWCEVIFQLALRNKSKLDLATIIEREVENFIVHQTPGIERCIERAEEVNGLNTIYLQTQGINLEAFFKHADVLDVNSVYSNDLNLVLTQYGVEACNRAIVTEMNNVFAVYGIEVSRRHLSLVADYMTFTGEIQAFNRTAMANNASPLQKMTFETTIAFMREALLQGEEDSLNGPSSRIVVGSLTRGGTGCFDLLISPQCFKPSSKTVRKQESEW